MIGWTGRQYADGRDPARRGGVGAEVDPLDDLISVYAYKAIIAAEAAMTLGTLLEDLAAHLVKLARRLMPRQVISRH